jgi:hypothetical protein
MFFVGKGRVLHLNKSGAREFSAVTAAFISPVVYCTFVKRTNFIGHHFLGPESAPLNGIAARAGFFIELAVSAHQTTI